MKNLLIIEDNYIMRLFLINYFNTDFNVEAVEKPHQGLELIKNNHFDMVIMDNHQVDSNDYTHLEKLIDHLKWQHVPNILLTDTEKSEERIHAIKIGAEYILSKPFNPVELSLRVKSRTGLINKKIQNVA